MQENINLVGANVVDLLPPLESYMVQIQQEIKPLEHSKHRALVNCFRAADFSDKILFFLKLVDV